MSDKDLQKFLKTSKDALEKIPNDGWTLENLEKVFSKSWVKDAVICFGRSEWH